MNDSKRDADRSTLLCRFLLKGLTMSRPASAHISPTTRLTGNVRIRGSAAFMPFQGTNRFAASSGLKPALDAKSGHYRLTPLFPSAY